MMLVELRIYSQFLYNTPNNLHFFRTISLVRNFVYEYVTCTWMNDSSQVHLILGGCDEIFDDWRNSDVSFLSKGAVARDHNVMRILVFFSCGLKMSI